MTAGEHGCSRNILAVETIISYVNGHEWIFDHIST